MSGEKRRENLLKILQDSDVPVSGTKLAEKFEVSRQVVVQDIALLRASNHNIISTHKGYVFQDRENIQRVFKVKHSEEKMLEELNLIVDLGGKYKIPQRCKKICGRDKRRSFSTTRADNIRISLPYSDGRFRRNIG